VTLQVIGAVPVAVNVVDGYSVLTVPATKNAGDVMAGAEGAATAACRPTAAALPTVQAMVADPPALLQRIATLTAPGMLSSG
jgi:hypothetical protein